MLNPAMFKRGLFRQIKRLVSSSLRALVLLPLSLLATIVNSSALSDNVAPINKLNDIIEQNTFQQIGLTTFSVLFWDIYKGRLLTTSGKYPVDAEKEQIIYEINYLADISSEDLITRTTEQWQHLGVSADRYQAYLPQLVSIWPDIVEGDTLSLLINKRMSYFYFNQNYIGTIEDPTFGQTFIAIWLAENTSQPTLRAELLGQQ